MLLYYWIYLSRCEKEMKCSASLAFYLFSPTRLINSIKLEHSCKILYVFETLLESLTCVMIPFYHVSSHYLFFYIIEPIQATSKGSDQTARIRRLIWGFAGRTYHIAGNLMPWLNYKKKLTLSWNILRCVSTVKLVLSSHPKKAKNWFSRPIIA